MKSLASLALLLATPAFAQELPAGDGPRGSSERQPGEQRYDEVGYAEVGERPGMTGAARGLRSGDHAEVTALDSGKTILIAIDADAPVWGELATLSPAAAASLGLPGGGAVRVRKVTPTPQEAGQLRQNSGTITRLDSPPSLLTALRKRLPAKPSLSSVPPKDLPDPPAPARPAKEPAAVTPKPNPSPTPAAKPPAPKAAQPAAAPKPAAIGKFWVQVAVLSDAARAKALATKVGGSVTPQGKLYRVRIGPLADRAAADRAKAKAATAGVRDATVIRLD